MEDQNEAADFWQQHALTFLEMAFRYDHRERLEQADGYAKKTGECGDTIEFFINLDGDTIKTIAYDIDGCINTNACCNAIATLVEGKTIAFAWDITPDTVASFLETLPDDHFHCAELAVGTLYLALSDTRENQRSPWKKMYR